MKNTQSTLRKAFSQAIGIYSTCLSFKLKQAKTGNKPKWVLPVIWMAIAISYNSCGIQAVKPIIGEAEKDIAPLAVDTMPHLAEGKVVYLTFDDGPNKGTGKVMEVLERAKVPATFFLVGEHVFGTDWQKATFQSILCNPSLEVANHTFYHARNKYNQFYQNPLQVLNDFQRMRDTLRLPTKIGRTPGMDVWRTSHISFDVCKSSNKAANLLRANGYTLVGWDVEWKANGKRQLKKTAKQLAAEIEEHFTERQTHTDDHLVLLLHDQHYVDSTNLLALAELIDLLKEKYRFEKVSGYPCL